MTLQEFAEKWKPQEPYLYGGKAQEMITDVLYLIQEERKACSEIVFHDPEYHRAILNRTAFDHASLADALRVVKEPE